MNSVHVGLKADPDGKCRPCLNAYTTVVIANNPITSIRHHAPRVGIHFPIPNERIAEYTENQINARPTR